MHTRCVTQPVLGQEHIPAHQGIQSFLTVPGYQMNVGSAMYHTGYRTYPILIRVDQPVYTANDIGFFPSSTSYHP